MKSKKAYGFPIFHCKTEFGELVYGEVYNETGDRLGYHTSSSVHFLEKDLLRCAESYDYVFTEEAPSFLKHLVK